MLLKLNKFWLLFIFLITPIIFSESIVNIEDLRRDGEEGFFANLSGSYSFSRGNRNRDSFSFQTSLDYNKNDLETFFVFKRAQKKINNNNYDSATLSHLRLNFLFEENPSLEVFLQYSKNPFRKFNKRELFGIGARFNIKENLKAGVGLMNEKEEDLLAVTDNTLRITSYVHNEFIIEEKNTISASLISNIAIFCHAMYADLQLVLTEFRFVSFIFSENKPIAELSSVNLVLKSLYAGTIILSYVDAKIVFLSKLSLVVVFPLFPGGGKTSEDPPPQELNKM